MNHRTWIEINRTALAGNTQALRALLEKGVQFCAVVKANAYGHGLEPVSTVLWNEGVRTFGVDTIDDAITLRAKFPEAQILVLGYTLTDRLEEAVLNDLELTVYDIEKIKRLEEHCVVHKKQANIHLKIETGTYRQGIFPNDLRTISDIILSCGHINLVGVSTHFANLEEPGGSEYASGQHRIFEESVQALKQAGHQPKWLHCASSAAVILYPATHGTLVRAGLSLYGIWPSEYTRQTARKHTVRCDIRPVLSWKTRIAQIKSVPSGTAVGYGLTEIVKRQSRIAVIPVGYFDGYDRKLSSVGEVLVNGHRCKVIGRICMNMCMVDISFVPNVSVEQEVVLLGETGRHRIPAERLASWADTIPYEVLSRINPSLPRLVV